MSTKYEMHGLEFAVTFRIIAGMDSNFARQEMIFTRLHPVLLCQFNREAQLFLVSAKVRPASQGWPIQRPDEIATVMFFG